jgi:hypothetical protein
MFFLTTAGSGEWNSQTLPQPQNTTPESANCFFTSLRSSAESVGSTPCLCVVRHSTAAMPTSLHTFSSVGKSQSFGTL